MGIGGVSPGSLILVFLIVFLVFGKNRIKELAEELASAVKIFKKTLDDDSIKTDQVNQDSRVDGEEVKGDTVNVSRQAVAPKPSDEN